MGKRWSVSFEPGRREFAVRARPEIKLAILRVDFEPKRGRRLKKIGASPAPFGFRVALCALVALFSWGAEAFAQPSPTPSDSDFLSLPAHDLELEAAGKEENQPAPQVGELRHYRIPSLQGKGLRLEETTASKGDESLSEQGWSVQAAEPTPSGEFQVGLVPLKSGEITIPSLKIVDPSGKAIARTNPLQITAQSAIRPDDPNPEKPADLKPPARLRFPWVVIALGAVVLAGLLALLIYAVVRWSRRKRTVSHQIIPAAPPRPEDEVALSALQELLQQGLIGRGEFKRHYFRVSEVMKNYIGARFEFDAAESTSLEIVARMEGAVADERLDRLETLFTLLDRVKFTDHLPSLEEAERVVSDAKRFVTETRRARGGENAVR